MNLTKDQISQLKKQLHDQIKHLPETQRKEAEIQIDEMSDESIEEMLENQKSQPKIFREIVSGKIPSKKVEESDQAIAVLDIKPISKGHIVIIPKEKVEQLDKISESLLKFAEHIARKVSDKFKPKKIDIIPEHKFGEAIINLIPIYDKELSLESERSSSDEDQLEKILEDLNKKEEVKVEVKKETPNEKQLIKKISRRIP